MGMVGRQYAANASYRFGFNGKENDNEVKGEGNQQDYGMRIYDPRVGKFLSIDPLNAYYAQLSPYQVSSNSPISGVDLDGEEFKVFHLIQAESNTGQSRLQVGDFRGITDVQLKPTATLSIEGSTYPVTIADNYGLADLGIQANVVDIGDRLVVLPGGIDWGNLPALEDPIWELFETTEEFVERINVNTTQLLSDFTNLVSLATVGSARVKSNRGIDKQLGVRSYKAYNELKKVRQKAVRQAWKEEKELVLKTGRGTRDWTEKEIRQLKRNGKVKGYDGHHINSVNKYPEMAGDPNNIKFLKSGKKEHLPAHRGNTRNPTSGELIDRKKLIQSDQ